MISVSGVGNQMLCISQAFFHLILLDSSPSKLKRFSKLRGFHPKIRIFYQGNYIKDISPIKIKDVSLYALHYVAFFTLIPANISSPNFNIHEVTSVAEEQCTAWGIQD